MKKALLTLFILFTTLFSFSQEVYYNDTYQNWVDLFHAEKFEQLYNELDEDVKSSNPHPLALNAWCVVYKTLNKTNEIDLIDIQRDVLLYHKLDDNGNTIELREAFPLEKIKHFDLYTKANWISKYKLTDSPSEIWAFIEELLLKEPENFRTAWTIHYLSSVNYAFKKQTLIKLDNGDFDNEQTLKQFIGSVMSLSQGEEVNYIKAIEDYLVSNPNETTAYRLVGSYWAKQQHYIKARNYYLKGHELDPFYYRCNSIKDVAKMYGKYLKYDSLAHYLAEYQKYAFSNSTEQENYFNSAELFIDLGTLGKARDVLTEAIEKYPEDEKINYLFGVLERKSARPGFAIRYLQKAVALNESSIKYKEELAYAYNDDKDYSELLSFINEVSPLTPTLFYLKQEVYDYYDEQDLLLETCKNGLKLYPYSSWLLGNSSYYFRKNKQLEKATELAKRRMEIDPYDSYSNSAIKWISKEEGVTKEELKDILHNQAITYPTSEYAWLNMVWEEETPDEKIIVLEEAIVHNPNVIWPYEDIRDVLVKDKNFDALYAYDEVISTSINENGDAYNKMQLELYFAKNVTKELSYYVISKEKCLEAIKHIESYKELGGKMSMYYEQLSKLYKNLGDTDKAREIALEATYYSPDDKWMHVDLIDKYSSPKGQERFYNLLMRNPYKEDVVNEYLRHAILWSGSPISALNMIHKYNYNYPNWTRKAYEMLGVNEDYKHDEYTSLSASQRYIGFYNNTRDNCWRAQPEVQIDYATNTAKIYYADGTYAERQDDLASGKVKKLQVGEFFVKAEYNENGSVTRIYTSGGDFVELVYNEDNKITELVNSKGAHFIYEYNDLGKPILIKSKDDGEISVSYDEYGEIDKVEATKGGYKMQMSLQQAMQNLLQLQNVLKESSTLSSGKLPDLGFDDEEYEIFYSKYNDTEYESKEWFIRGFELSEYLNDNTVRDADYGPEALDILATLFESQKESVTTKNYKQATQNIELFHSVLYKVRKRGVALDYWNTWSSMQDWLAVQKFKQKKLNNFRKEIERLEIKFQDEPIVLLKNTEWLPKSWINNEGYWDKKLLSDIIPEELSSNVSIHTSFVRSNGDVLLGSSKGFGVLRNGYWEWFIYNPFQSKFTDEIELNKLDGFSEIISITEDDNGHLFLGTLKGVLKIEGNYSESVKRFSDSKGLSSNKVRSLKQYGSATCVATENGFSIIVADEIYSTPELASNQVYDIELMEDRMYVSTNTGIYQIQNSMGENNEILVKMISPSIRKQISILEDDSEMSLLTNSRDEVFKLYFDESSNEFIEIPVYDNILTSETKLTFGMEYFPITENSSALGILTDYGISFYKDNHFEYYSIPGAESKSLKGTAFKQHTSGTQIVAFSDREVFVFEDSDITINEINDGVSEIITFDSLGMTFVAGGGLSYIIHNDKGAKMRSFDYVSTNHIAKFSEDQLIANDGRTINRYSFDSDGDYSTEELFYAEQYEVGGYSGGPVYDIMVSADSVIWVTTELSVFRYEELDSSSTLEEFNFFLDDKKFPSNSHWHYAVHELLNGDIVAIASNEGHLDYKGLSLNGGILWYNKTENSFERDHYKNDPRFNPPSWFISSHTQVAENKAIIGTIAGFGEINGNVIQKYSTGFGDVNNQSYLSLKKEHPNLYLGTKGVQIGDIWLFGCSAGVVGLNNGVWFYPDRINKMLPKDLEFSNYGSRHVNSLSIDPNGRIYIGTDLGLLTYEIGGKSAVSFLMSDFDQSSAFVYQNTQSVIAEGQQIIESIDSKSSAGKIIKELKETEAEIKKLELIKDVAQKAYSIDEPSIRVASVDSINVVLKARTNKHAELLINLETSEPAIYQALEVDPIDLISFRSKLKEDEVIVQYIPLNKHLFIHVVSKDKLVLEKIKIDRKSLMDSIQRVTAYLANPSNARGVVVENTNLPELDINAELMNLYKILIKPIYKNISFANKVYIIPNDALYYLPFAALIKDDGSEKYIVEEMNIGYLSSLHLYKLFYETELQNDGRIVLFGDPDGTLPGAREEVEAIADMVGVKAFCGKAATTKQFLASVNGAKYVHIASHAQLDNVSLKDSWLLFSDRKFKLTEAFDLPLSETELVVLSACETGLGGEGIEYATLARSFSNAGASTILATLWQVNDEASMELMIKFYEALAQGKNKFEALAIAQRFLISNEKTKHPALWSAYIPIGKP